MLKVEQYVSDKYKLVVEAEDIKQLFRELKPASEIVGAAQKCGNCGSTNISFIVREAADTKNPKKMYEFFELKCEKCKAKLQFGQLSDGSEGLFPKRKDDEGNYKPNGGWEVYKPQKEQRR